MKNQHIRHNRFAMITGASSGIGKAIAEELARYRTNLLLVALPGTGLEDVGEELRVKYDVKVHTVCINLLDKDAAQEVFRFSLEHQVRVNILVNNAGFGNLELFEQSRIEELTSMIELNNRALVSLTHIFLPMLKKNKHSYVLNVGSLASLFPIPGKAIYSATKSFVYCFSAALRQEMKNSSISVSCLCPGATLTSARVLNNMNLTSVKANVFVQKPEQVAREAVNGMFDKTFRIIPGLHNRLLFMLWRILPSSISSGILQRVFAKSISAKRRPTTNLMSGSRSYSFTSALVQR